ncbi:MAG: glycosyltransferase family 4 protein [Defluviitaleaceae bacterium]|nr:glycosyltransferase family 4 protein [Defluviitaleaceae bacterium]
MKLCFILNSIHSHGGIQRMQATLSNELCKAHDITIIEARLRPRKQYAEKCPYPLSPEVKLINCTPFKSRISYIIRRRILGNILRLTGLANIKVFYRLWFWLTFPSKLQKELTTQINNENYDMVIAVAVYNTVLLSYISEKINAKTVSWLRNPYERYFGGRTSCFWGLEKIFKESLKNINECIVLTHDMKKNYDKHLNISTCVIPNARSFVSEEKSKVQAKMFVACGRFVAQKGFDLLISAFNEFAKTDAEWELTIVGDGPSRLEVESLIKKFDLCERITITGFVDNVNDYLLNSSIFLMTSRYEGFGNVIAEAFEIGLPIIAWDVDSIDLIENGSDGILVAPFDTSAYAAQMLKLSSDDTERKRMAQNAATKAEQFSVEKVAEKWEILFDGILHKEI